MFQPLDIAIRRWFGDGRAVELALGNREQGIVDQRGFTRAGDAGDAGKQAHWQGERYILQVVAARAGQLEDFLRVGGHALLRHFNFAFTAHELAGQGFRDRHNGLQRPFRYYLAAVNASAGTDIDHMVGGANGVFVVLNDDHRVA